MNLHDPTVKIRALQLLSVLMLLLISTQTLSAPRTVQLFSIERNKNANVLHYALNLDASGKPVRSDPITAHWRMLAEDGRREELTWLERTFAYGWSIISKITIRGFTMRLAAWRGREIHVEPGDSKPYIARVLINGRASALTKIYVEAEETGALPKVRSVVLHGKELITGQPLSERITP
jgi:hypothetical protein